MIIPDNAIELITQIIEITEKLNKTGYKLSQNPPSYRDTETSIEFDDILSDLTGNMTRFPYRWTGVDSCELFHWTIHVEGDKAYFLFSASYFKRQRGFNDYIPRFVEPINGEKYEIFSGIHEAFVCYFKYESYLKELSMQDWNGKLKLASSLAVSVKYQLSPVLEQLDKLDAKPSEGESSRGKPIVIVYMKNKKISINGNPKKEYNDTIIEAIAFMIGAHRGAFGKEGEDYFNRKDLCKAIEKPSSLQMKDLFKNYSEFWPKEPKKRLIQQYQPSDRKTRRNLWYFDIDIKKSQVKF